MVQIKKTQILDNANKLLHQIPEIGRSTLMASQNRTFRRQERKIAMAKMIKGSTRYVLLRGKDERGESIVIDIFNKKQLDDALREGRITETDNVVKIQVVGKAPLKEKSV